MVRRVLGRRVVQSACCLVFLYLSGCVAMCLLEDQMVYPRQAAAPPLPKPPRAETVVLSREVPEVGRVEAWFIPAPGVSADHPGPVVVFCHGNSELIDHQNHVVDAYHGMGCSVLLPEYRGYGRAAGRPAQAGIVEDVVCFHDQMLKRPEVDAGRVVIHGRSLGGGVACQLAGQRPPAALILESTFTSIACYAHRYLVPEFLVRNPWRSDEVVARLDVPVLICHGIHDRVVPVEHARRLRDLARRPTYVEFPCDHNDFPGAGNGPAFWGQVEAFLDQTAALRK